MSKFKWQKKFQGSMFKWLISTFEHLEFFRHWCFVSSSIVNVVITLRRDAGPREWTLQFRKVCTLAPHTAGQASNGTRCFHKTWLFFESLMLKNLPLPFLSVERQLTNLLPGIPDEMPAKLKSHEAIASAPVYRAAAGIESASFTFRQFTIRDSLSGI